MPILGMTIPSYMGIIYILYIYWYRYIIYIYIHNLCVPVSSNFLIWPWHISSSSFPGKARGAFVFSPGPSQGLHIEESKQQPGFVVLCPSLQNGYGSIPINTIFRGMNIHLPAILMWTTGVQGFDTLPNPAKSPCILLQFSTFNMEVS